MCPYPAQVTREQIVENARALIEAEGLEDLSLSKLATALGIKAPSLYKHVASKSDLLRAVNAITNRELIAAIQQAVVNKPQPAIRVRAMAQAYRNFAHTYPITYALAFSMLPPDQRPDPRELEQLALPLQQTWAAICGPEESLAALRGALALIHGFIILELNGQFQRGGDLTEHFTRVVEVYIEGWVTRQSG